MKLGTLADVLQLAHATLQRYLAQFPEDRDRLAVLCSQLANEDAGVLERSNMHGHITTSTVTYDPLNQAVLLIHHKLYNEWYPPGGHYEFPGSLWDSAAREALEETGVIVEPYTGLLLSEGTPLDIDTHPIPANPKKQERAHFHHDFTYVGTASSALLLTPQVEEVHGAKWVSLAEFLKSESPRSQRIAQRLQQLILH